MAYAAKMSDTIGVGDHKVSDRPIDLVHLATYTLGNRALESELLGMFRTQADLYVSKLETAQSEIEWKNTAHSLKGSARGLGAWAVGELAEQAERAAGADANTRRALLAEISTALAAVKTFIDQMSE